jgi:hypothetical protein
MINTIGPIDSIKRDIKRIRRAGFKAEIFGWLLTLGAAGLIWVAGTKTDTYLIYGVFLIVGLYFIYSGKYIKDGRGKRTRLALLLNWIISFPLCVGIIPIYICVQSFNNYNRFNNLPDNIKELYNKPKRFKIKLIDLILLIAVLIIGAVALILKINHFPGPGSPAKNPITTNEAVIDKVSDYNFTIKFPNVVTSANLSQQVSGHNVPYVIYDSFANHNSVQYEVYTYSWPSQYFKFSQMSQPAVLAQLKSTLSSISQSLNATVASSSQSTFKGYISLDAQISVPNFKKTTTTSYVNVFFVDNYEYGILSIGTSRSDFNNFANTFQYDGN